MALTMEIPPTEVLPWINPEAVELEHELAERFRDIDRLFDDPEALNRLLQATEEYGQAVSVEEAPFQEHQRARRRNQFPS